MRDLVTALAVGVPFLVGASVSPHHHGHVVMRFADPRIVEGSGLVAGDGVVVAVNDSGNDARIYTVDLDTGRTVGTTTWDADALDTEALAPAGRGEVWVGDIGDNLRGRSEIEVTRVPYGRGDRSVAGETYRLAYPDGASDAESLLADPTSGRLYVVTKDVLGGGIYAAPALDPDRVNLLERVGDAPPVATDAAFFPDGDHIIVRNYGAATVYAFPSMAEVGTVDLPHQQQGEGIAVDQRGRIYLSSEGAHSALLEISLPPQLAREVNGSAIGGHQPDDDPDRSSDESDLGDRDPWPWLAGGAFGLVAIVVLLRSLRPR